jgi:hypothetical protein
MFLILYDVTISTNGTWFRDQISNNNENNWTQLILGLLTTVSNKTIGINTSINILDWCLKISIEEHKIVDKFIKLKTVFDNYYDKVNAFNYDKVNAFNITTKMYVKGYFDENPLTPPSSVVWNLSPGRGGGRRKNRKTRRKKRKERKSKRKVIKKQRKSIHRKRKKRKSKNTRRKH